MHGPFRLLTEYRKRGMIDTRMDWTGGAGQRFPYDFLLNSEQYSKVGHAPKTYI